MGLNIYVQTIHGDKHASWDCARYAGDREFISMSINLPSVEHCDLLRPTDFSAWDELAKKLAAKYPNNGRLAGLLNLLKSEPDYWVRISY